MKRTRLLLLEQAISRRGFLAGVFRSTALAASLPAISSRLWGLRRPTEQQRTLAASVYSALGALTIPVDEDPGWSDFEPGISDYGLTVFLRQILLNGDPDAFDAYIETLNHLNNVPVLLNYNVEFLRMAESARLKYLADILTGQFENDGWQDVLTLAAGLAITSAKMVFFSNYPRHLATPGAEYQQAPASPLKTGWDIMQWRGPVGPQEEQILRDRARGVVEVPGIDTRSPFL